MMASNSVITSVFKKGASDGVENECVAQQGRVNPSRSGVTPRLFVIGCKL